MNNKKICIIFNNPKLIFRIQHIFKKFYNNNFSFLCISDNFEKKYLKKEISNFSFYQEKNLDLENFIKTNKIDYFYFYNEKIKILSANFFNDQIKIMKKEKTDICISNIYLYLSNKLYTFQNSFLNLTSLNDFLNNKYCLELFKYDWLFQQSENLLLSKDIILKIIKKYSIKYLLNNINSVNIINETNKFSISKKSFIHLKNKEIKKLLKEFINKNANIDFVYHVNKIYKINNNVLIYDRIMNSVKNKNIRKVFIDFNVLFDKIYQSENDFFEILSFRINKHLKKIDYFDFVRVRNQAEKNLIKKNVSNYNVDNIYEEIEGLIPYLSEHINYFKNLEIETFFETLNINKNFLYLIDFFHVEKKEINIFINTTINENLINHFFQKNNLLNKIDNVYINKFDLFDGKNECDSIFLMQGCSYKNNDFMYYFDDKYNIMFNKTNIVKSDLIKYLNSFITPAFKDPTAKLNLRLVYKIISNKIYDDLFFGRNWMIKSDFNSDPNIIGYFILGMILFSICKWLFNESIKNNYNKFVFNYRDGYLFEEGFKIFCKHNLQKIETHKTFFSRSSLFPFLLKNKDSISSIPFFFWNTTIDYKYLISLIKNYISNDDIEKLNILNFKKINLLDFSNLLYKNKIFINNKIFPLNKFKELNLSSIFSEKTGFFEFGYSGRVSSVIYSCFGIKLNEYNYYGNSTKMHPRKNVNNLNIQTFYDFKPSKTFNDIREIFFSKYNAGTLGFFYNFDENAFKVKKDKFNFNCFNFYIYEHFQKQSLKFIDDIFSKTRNFIDLLDFDKLDLCYPFEFYVNHSKEIDRSIFNFTEYENNFDLLEKNNNFISNWNKHFPCGFKKR